MKKYISLVFFAFCSHFVFTQTIDLFVKKGDVFVSSKKVKVGEVIKLKTSDVLELGTNARVIIKGNATMAEVPAGLKYSYKKLKNILAKKTTYSKAFVEVVTNQQVTLKKSAGVTTRGGDFDPWEYFPSDSSIILVDSLELSFGSENLRLLTNILIYQKGKTDTLVLTKNSLHNKITGLSPGLYIWEYTAKYTDTSRKYQNFFIIPSDLDRKKHLDEYFEFQKSLEDFSPDMRDLLMNEYLELKKIIVN